MDAGRRYRSRSGSPHAFVLDDSSVSLTSTPWQHKRVIRTHCLHATFMILQDRCLCDVGSARVSGGRSATLGGRSAISGFGPSRGKSCVAVLLDYLRTSARVSERGAQKAYALQGLDLFFRYSSPLMVCSWGEPWCSPKTLKGFGRN